METPPDFFGDCLGDFGDPNPYPGTPRWGVAGAEDLSEVQQAFSSISARPGTDSPASSTLNRRANSKSSTWDSVFGPCNDLGPNDAGPNAVNVHHSPVIVDPGLYGMAGFRAGELHGRRGAGSRSGLLSQEDTSQPSTRRASGSSIAETKSGSTSTDMTTPDQEPATKRGTHRAKGDPAMDETEEKRLKFLERNRIAASKCREKKKAYVSNLEDKKISLEAQHTALQLEYSALMVEIGGLKHSLMAHSKCGDANIDAWLSNEASRFVQTRHELFGTSYAGLGPLRMLPNPAHSRNSSTASYPSLAGLSMDGMSPGERRGSMTYSHASPLQASPTDASFPPHDPILEPSHFQTARIKTEPGLNYDHMPDTMFDPDQSPYGSG